MVTKTLPARDEVAIEHKWNLEAIYEQDEKWESDFREVAPLMKRLAEFQGRLGESGDTLLEALQLRSRLSELMERLFAYARMRRDEDTTNARYQGMEDRARALWTRVQEATSFYNPELLKVGRDKVEHFKGEVEGLGLYDHMLDELFRRQEHMLNESEEALLASASDLAAGPGQIFDMLNDADMKYGTVIDEEGNEVELTHGRYGLFIRSTDRRLRRDAFFKFHEAYERQRNTIATCYSTQVKADIFYARARKYSSSLEAALFNDNIPAVVYDNLIEAVHENLPLLHRYMGLRKRVLDLDRLEMFDLHVPLIKEAEHKVAYDRAIELCTEAFMPMGEQYMAAVREGFTSRWTDVHETPNKTSGAYSWGVYGVHPFMLLNYQDTLNDLFTLAHEMGHSMHTYFSYKHQPYLYHDYTTFVAEVASTLNEELLSHHLLETTDDQAVRMSVVNYSLEQFRTTLYRQTMFAEFEKIAHERAEAGEALTAEVLSEIHYDLNLKYHGDNVHVNDEIAIEWARIPHFYNSFYVFQYATGISAAVALSQQILSEGEAAVERYVRFLSKGGSDYSINLLKEAGVDMASPEPVRQALAVFGERIEEMEKLLGVTQQASV